MTLSPFLSGSIVAEDHMADARREAERRRLVRSAERGRGFPNGWLLQLMRGLGLRSYCPGDRTTVRRTYGTNRSVQSAKP